MNPLMPTRGYIASPIIVAVNVIIFLMLVAMNFSLSNFSDASLYYFGANFPHWVNHGQWWRFLTSMFVHFNLMHLLFNCASILFVGRYLEPLLGTRLFTLVYFATGICGSFASYMLNTNALSAGASGAIFGLFGVFLAILLSNLVFGSQRDEWLKTIGGIIVLNLLMGLVLPYDNAAHIGGLISGVILGFLAIPHIKRRLHRPVR